MRRISCKVFCVSLQLRCPARPCLDLVLTCFLGDNCTHPAVGWARSHVPICALGLLICVYGRPKVHHFLQPQGVFSREWQAEFRHGESIAASCRFEATSRLVLADWQKRACLFTCRAGVRSNLKWSLETHVETPCKAGCELVIKSPSTHVNTRSEQHQRDGWTYSGADPDENRNKFLLISYSAMLPWVMAVLLSTAPDDQWSYVRREKDCFTLWLSLSLINWLYFIASFYSTPGRG